jgi:putative two-component system response regulator
MKNDKILVVDDTVLNLDTILEYLEDFEVFDTTDGYDALEILEEEDIDLILLDIVMPEIDGFEVCQRLKDNPKTKDIPVIFLTSKTDENSIAKAYDVGGVDYVTKPFRKQELLARIDTHLSLTKQKFLLKNLVDQKTEELQNTNKELHKIQKDLILAMGIVGENRCLATSKHVNRVAEYSKLLATLYGLNEKDIETLTQTSPMHDIGKVAIADHILQKPSKLTDEEFEIMKTHSEIGYSMFKDFDRELLKSAAIIAHQHHEKWDGTGYPRGLKGEEIHIFGRITALIDVFDALGEERVYKKAMPDDKILQIIQEERGKHFEPELVDIFLENFDKFTQIRETLQ